MSDQIYRLEQELAAKDAENAALRERCGRLEAALREALEYVTPDTSYLVQAYSGDEAANEECKRIAAVRDRLAAALAPEAPR